MAFEFFKVPQNKLNKTVQLYQFLKKKNGGRNGKPQSNYFVRILNKQMLFLIKTLQNMGGVSKPYL